MVWFKVDDTLAFHAKVIAAGNPAMGLWVRAGAWCAQQLTDGHVPTQVARTLGTARQAKSLVESGLWEATPGGYSFHDWSEDERQPTREQVESKREQWREKKRRQRAKGSENTDRDQRGRFSSPDMSPGDTSGDSPGASSATRPGPSRPTTSYGSSGSSTRAGAEPNPQPEMSSTNLLAAAGLARHEIRDFLVDLKGTGARNTTALVNALHRDGKLARRIAEWRDERNLAAEAASRPTPGKKTTSDKVRDGFDLARRLAAEEAAADNVTQLRQIEGA